MLSPHHLGANRRSPVSVSQIEMFSLGLECPGLIPASQCKGVLEMFDLLSAEPGIGAVGIWRDRVWGVVPGGRWTELSPVGQEGWGETGALMFGRVIGKGELVDPSVPVAVILGGVLGDHCLQDSVHALDGIALRGVWWSFPMLASGVFDEISEFSTFGLPSVVGDNDAGAAVS